MESFSLICDTFVHSKSMDLKSSVPQHSSQICGCRSHKNIASQLLCEDTLYHGFLTPSRRRSTNLLTRTIHASDWRFTSPTSSSFCIHSLDHGLKQVGNNPLKEQMRYQRSFPIMGEIGFSSFQVGFDCRAFHWSVVNMWTRKTERKFRPCRKHARRSSIEQSLKHDRYGKTHWPSYPLHSTRSLLGNNSISGLIW